ncbi:protein kinase [Streptomyces sp. NPDC048484]|uniref:serine/threonine-protein kinase n=1 Tax=Streptomyces sp. NPDC048484 TaxID=3155146 RepID=UPI00341411AB
MSGDTPGRGEGRLISGRYRLLRTLGAGGMGRVWLAYDEELACEVSMKEINLPDLPMESAESESGGSPDRTDPKSQERIARARSEARNAARLRGHPHVATVHDVLMYEGLPWIVMEFVPDAVDLQTVVRRSGPLTPEQTARIGLGVLGALTAGHRIGILHRDVKPANILLAPDASGDPYARVLLTDYGIALQPESREPRLTATAGILGTPGYLAPERARGEPPTPAADMFSLGATLYATVEGRGPFDRHGEFATFTALLSEEPTPPERAGELAPVLHGLLVKDPVRRFSPEAVARGLERVVQTPRGGVFGPPPGMLPGGGAAAPGDGPPWSTPTPGSAQGAAPGPAFGPVPGAGQPGAGTPGSAPGAGQGDPWGRPQTPGFAPGSGPPGSWQGAETPGSAPAAGSPPQFPASHTPQGAPAPNTPQSHSTPQTPPQTPHTPGTSSAQSPPGAAQGSWQGPGSRGPYEPWNPYAGGSPSAYAGSGSPQSAQSSQPYGSAGSAASPYGSPSTPYAGNGAPPYGSGPATVSSGGAGGDQGGRGGGERRRKLPAGAVVAIVVALVLVIGGAWAVVTLGGDDKKEPKAGGTKPSSADDKGPSDEQTGPALPYGQQVGLKKPLQAGDCVRAVWSGAAFKSVPNLGVVNCADDWPDGQVVAVDTAADYADARDAGSRRCERQGEDIAGALPDADLYAVLPTKRGFEAADGGTACLVLGRHAAIGGEVGRFRDDGTKLWVGQMSIGDCWVLKELEDTYEAPLTDCANLHTDQVIGVVPAPAKMDYKKGAANANKLCSNKFESTWASDPERVVYGWVADKNDWNNGFTKAVCTVSRADGTQTSGKIPAPGAV